MLEKRKKESKERSKGLKNKNFLNANEALTVKPHNGRFNSMFKYVIEGGHPIRGRIKASGNKNAALPCLVAALLTDEPVFLSNLPDIEDVKVMVEILEALGARVEQQGPNEWLLDCSSATGEEIPENLATRIRASLLFAGPVLSRMGRVVLSPPGGDFIGRRRLDTHFLAFAGLGAKIEVDQNFTITAKELVGNEIFLDEASVTATENALMVAVKAKGETIIRNAASEPHVQNLCTMLNAMGAQIKGIASNVLRIKGVPILRGCRFAIGADFMEVGSLIGLTAATGGDLLIENAEPEHLRMCRVAFGKLGIHWETEGKNIHVLSGQKLKVVPDMGGAIPVIDDAPWPGFPPDLTSIMTVVATQAEGTVLIHEKMFESRMFFVDKLIAMGAGIILCDPHRAVVSGPSRLKGAELSSPDIRAGMAMVIAAMIAEGTSIIRNVYEIERGYENLVLRLKTLGARIERVGE